MTDSLLPTYIRAPLRFERGKGCWLYTETGQAFLDCASGVAVNALGHAHPALVSALQKQAEKLWHSSNLYDVPNQEKLADLLVDASFADRVFFGNSGTEACELAVKMARRYWHGEGQPQRDEIIGIEGAFHGRSSAGIAAAGSAALSEGFGRLLPGFKHMPFGDIAALEAAISENTAGVIVEPVQGEGGIRVCPEGYLQAIEALCRKHGAFLIVDEVQCGMGRSGHLFAYQPMGVTPDIMMVAKGIGGGFPLGCVLASEEAAKHMGPGSHGSTYGGNPLAMAVGLTVLETINQPEFLAEVRRKGTRFIAGLHDLVAAFPSVFSGVRGMGLMLGMQCKIPAADFMTKAYEAELLLVPAKDNVVRILPPLNIEDSAIDTGLERLHEIAQGLSAKAGTETRETK